MGEPISWQTKNNILSSFRIFGDVERFHAVRKCKCVVDAAGPEADADAELGA